MGSEENAYKITFEEPKGTSLLALFWLRIVSRPEFTGVKVDVGKHPPIVTSSEWARRNENAYERARTGRWGGW
jgi:hypothetical protein